MVIPFFYVLGSAGMASLLARRRWEEALPLALMGSAFVLYLSGLAFDSLWAGYVLCVGFALGLPVTLAVLGLRACRERRMGAAQGSAAPPAATSARANFCTAVERLVTPAFAIFCGLCAVIFLLDWNKGFTMWDEYSHWGPMVRETLRLDALYTSPQARAFVHPDYPPIVCLFETLWCKLAGGYREAYLYRALHVLSFSLFFPALSRLHWGKREKASGKGVVALACTAAGLLALLIGLPLSIELEDGGFYSTIYLDCLLGLLLAYGVFLVLDAKRWGAFELIRLGVALSFLLLTKQMGIAFYVLIVGILVVDVCLTRWACARTLLSAHKTAREIPCLCARALGAVGALVGLPLLLSRLWGWHVAALGLGQQFNLGGISWNGVLQDATGTGSQGWKQQVLADYFEALGSYRIVVWGKLHVPYWALGLLFVVLLLCALWGSKKLVARGRALACAGLLLGGGVAYAFAMMITYLTSFSQAESMRLASFPRYLGTYPFALAMLFGMVVLRGVCAATCTAEGDCPTATSKAGRLWKPAFVVWSVVVLLWLFCMPAQQAQQLVPTREYRSSSTVYDEMVREVQRRIPAGGSVLLVTQQQQFARDPGFYNIMLQYRMPEREVAVIAVNLPAEAQSAEHVAQLTDTLQAFNYVYLSNVDERFTAVYAPLLAGNTAQDKQIYKVEHSKDGAVRLALLA